MATPRGARSQQARARVAEVAAQFMAEHGISDYALAKRKAARQLGLTAGHTLPSNEEVDAALLERQSLFEPEEQSALLDRLRRQALEVMEVFAQFAPVLTGAVASGIVSEHSPIELEIAEADSKEFEQFLVNRDIEYKVQDRNGRMAYLVYAEPADIAVRMVAQEMRRGAHLSRDRLARLLDLPLPDPAFPSKAST